MEKNNEKILSSLFALTLIIFLAACSKEDEKVVKIGLLSIDDSLPFGAI